MNLQCLRCGNPSRDGGLCDNDEKALADTLAEAPGLLAELEIQATRQSVGSRAEVRSQEIPLPVNLAAADLAAGLETLLVSWARACGGEDDPDLRGAGTEAAMWLARRIYSIRMHEAAAEIVDELVQHSRECWRAVDRNGSADIYLGDCQKEREDQPCGTPLRVHKDAPSITCWRCDTEYDVEALKDQQTERLDRSNATAKEIASAEWRTPDGRLINARMIEGYARRGSIMSRGIRDGARLFNIGEVKKAAFAASFPKAHLSSGNTRLSA